LGFEVAFEDQDGGYLVYYGAVFYSGTAGGVEVAVGFGGGEPLVPEVNGEGGLVAEHPGEGLNLVCLGALISRHVEGVADDNFDTRIFADEPVEGFQVLLAIGADEGEDGLGGEAEGIGNGNTDAAVSYVETHDPGDCSWLVHFWMVQAGVRGGTWLRVAV
jgi:hypothetical protein